MKKNSNETENIVINPIMNEEEMQQFVEENIHMVPKNQQKKFDAMTLKQKVSKIQLYQDIARMREEARIKNSILNRTKELFDKRHATVDDAREVLQFCTEFIDNFRQHQIEEIDRQIAELEQKKKSL